MDLNNTLQSNTSNLQSETRPRTFTSFLETETFNFAFETQTKTSYEILYTSVCVRFKATTRLASSIYAIILQQFEQT